jgi:hypothetical protein
MKLLIRALLALVCLSSVVHAESPLVFCDRVGATIDRQERDYFLLFPGKDDFYSAEAFKTIDGGVSFEISTGPDSLRKVEFRKADQAVLNELTHYINEFESLLAHDATYNHIILAGWAGLAEGARKQKQGAIIEIRTKRGEFMEGRLFCVMDSAIVVSPISYTFSPETANECRTFQFGDINDLRLGRSSPRSGIYAGVPVGMAVLAGMGYLEYSDMNAAEFILIGGFGGGILGGLIASFKQPSTLWLGGSMPSEKRWAFLLKHSGTHAVPPEFLPNR